MTVFRFMRESFGDVPVYARRGAFAPQSLARSAHFLSISSGGERESSAHRTARRLRTVQMFAVDRRRLPFDPAEDPVELRQRLKAGFVGGFAHARVWVKEQLLRLLH